MKKHFSSLITAVLKREIIQEDRLMTMKNLAEVMKNHGNSEEAKRIHLMQ